MNEVCIPGVTYHGGFSWQPEATRAGTLVLNDDTLTLDRIIHESLTRNTDPPVELCRTKAVASIEVTSQQVAKSKLGAAVTLGLLGAVTAKGTAERVTLVVTLKSGEAGYLTADGQSTPALLGKVSPWLREHGVELIRV